MSKKTELKEIFTPYITRNGKRIYRKDGRVWHFWVEEKKANRKVKPFIKTTPACVVFYILKNLKTSKATQISNSKVDILY
jgi:hypothetical protein